MLGIHAQLGPYRIGSLIGRGGMGEVYRARDTRLGRDVAIKTVLAEAAHDPELRARAEREARTVAALNHAHICAIHDIGRDGSIEYIVFEYVEGETLAAILRRGPLTLDRTLEYAVQIADALAIAHESGVIHRDLKPGNIMIHPAAGVKLLDFGLAKISGRNIALSPDSTVTAMPEVLQTTEGAIVGTLNYMSPEQAEGKPIDARTDIFSFGSVIYEMLTGRKAFDGESSVSVLSAILRDEPKRIGDIATGIPEGLARVVEHCLRKDRRQRFQHMADLRFSLEAVRDELRPAPAANAGPQRTRPRAAVIWIGLLALATAGAALIPRYFTSGSAPPEPTTRSTILLAGEDVLDTRGSSLALSKDGRLLAFVGSTGTSSRLYVRPLDAFDPTPLPGTEDAMSPFFSPTGDWLGFFANGKLQKIRVDGGKPIVLCDADVGRGGAWAADDTIVFNPSAAFGAGLMRISAAGGTPQPISHPDPMQDEQSHRWPEFLPDGKHVLFTIWTSTGLSTSRLAVLDLATGKLRTLSEVGSYGRFASGGLLAFIRSEGLMISRLDPEALTFKEAPVFTGVSVLGSGSNGTAQFDIGPSGLLIYAAGVNSSRSILVSVDRNGSEQPLYDKPGFYVTPRLSPDGKHLLFGAVDSGNFDVWAMELARKSPVRVTFGRTAEYYSIWEADGKHVTYSSNRQGPLNLFSSPADGTALEQRLTTAPNPQFANEWTRDGSILAFTQFGADTGSDIWLLKKGAASPVSFLQTSFSERDPAFSPNGKWLAYTSNESGANEVYVRSVAGIGKSKISVAGGTEPVWTASGRELLFRRGNEMMAAAIRMQPFFAADPPRALFRGNYSAQHSSRNYDVTADGRQFVMMKNVDDQSPPRALHVVSNAFKELSGRRELKRP